MLIGIKKFNIWSKKIEAAHPNQMKANSLSSVEKSNRMRRATNQPNPKKEIAKTP
jgi:hypothetical protein